MIKYFNIHNKNVKNAKVSWQKQDNQRGLPFQDNRVKPQILLWLLLSSTLKDTSIYVPCNQGANNLASNYEIAVAKS